MTSNVEILENLPSATKGKDGEGDLIDNTIGAVLDAAGTIGILPSAENDGGYVTQIATQLFGDNRAGIVVEDKSKMEALGLEERQPEDGPTDWDYEQITMVKTTDGIKPLSEVDNPEGLEQVTRYRTNPDKHLVIGDPTDASGNANVEDYKIRISEDDIKDSGIDHLFTNGMFNNHDTAVFNQQSQQGGADGILNYNQQHGVLGDLLESAQDAIAVNTGISTIGTGGARQTGDLIGQIVDTNIRNGDLTVGAHSQGTLMTQVGLNSHSEELGNIVQGNTNANFLVQYSGAPVNHAIAEQTITGIYGGEEALIDRVGDKGIDSVFRSNSTPEDAVAGILGYNGAGINSSENLGANMGASFLAIPRLFGIGDPSPHSYYPCVIGCGEENFTPKKDNYYNPNSSDGTNQSVITQYYEDNLKNDKGELSVDISLLSSIGTTENLESEQILLDTTGEK